MITKYIPNTCTEVTCMSHHWGSTTTSHDSYVCSCSYYNTGQVSTIVINDPDDYPPEIGSTAISNAFQKYTL